MHTTNNSGFLRRQRYRKGRNTKRRESRVSKGRKPREVTKYTCITNCQRLGHCPFTRSVYNREVNIRST